MKKNQISTLESTILSFKKLFKPSNGVNYIEPQTYNMFTYEESKRFDKMKQEDKLQLLKRNDNNKFGNPYKDQQFNTKRLSIDDYRK